MLENKSDLTIKNKETGKLESFVFNNAQEFLYNKTEHQLRELSCRIESLTKKIDILIASMAGAENTVERFESKMTATEVLNATGKAESPQKSKKGRPKKTKVVEKISADMIKKLLTETVVDAQDETSFLDETSIDFGFPEVVDESQVAVTSDDVKEMALELIKCDPSGAGFKKAKEVLRRFGYKALVDVTENKFKDIYDALKKEVESWGN